MLEDTERSLKCSGRNAWSREIPGRYQKVAVMCWYTSGGKSMPQLVKYQDGEGYIHTIRDICVVRSDEKRSAGHMSRRYECRGMEEEREMLFILFYHPSQEIWDMAIQNR